MHIILENILQTLFPSACACCGETLMRGEREICLNCATNLSSTHFSAFDDNPAERLLAGGIYLEHATSLYFFQQGNTVQRLIHAMKFKGNSDLCLLMGRQLGLDLLRSSRFDDIDLLVPVPLHWLRRYQRGYNQSELLCRGIAQVMPRPVNTSAFVRRRNTKKQSQQNHSQRESNTLDAFWVRRPEELAGRHILLVDDVVTTGATLRSCCQELSKVSGIRISIATLSIAHS